MNETKVAIYWELLLSIFIGNCRNSIDFSAMSVYSMINYKFGQPRGLGMYISI